MWWDALRSDFMLGNGLPVLTHAASEPPSSSSAPKTIVDPPRKGGARPRKKRRKGAGTDAQKTMLWRMNDNIRTLRRVREVHARLTVLKDAADDPSGESGFLVPPPPVEELDDPVDDRPWSIPAAGIDIGEENADGCMHWMSSKVLEHAGFQGACAYMRNNRGLLTCVAGTSKVALDVLAGVASDYLLNVGRNLQFLTEKYANKMTPEEIILHTLFESGVTRAPYDLERYIKEDVVRYGNRMNDLEKKLSHAYSEAVRGKHRLRALGANIIYRRQIRRGTTRRCSAPKRTRKRMASSSCTSGPIIATTCAHKTFTGVTSQMRSAKTFWGYANLVSPQNSGFRVSASRRSYSKAKSQARYLVLSL